MVVALEGLVDGEVLLDDVGATGHRGDRHVVATLMAGVTDWAVAQDGQTIHVTQVDVLEGGRVGRLALQQGELGTGTTQYVDRPEDLVLGRHTGGDQHRQVLGGAGAQQGVVGHVGAGDLESRDAVVGQHLEAG